MSVAFFGGVALQNVGSKFPDVGTVQFVLKPPSWTVPTHTCENSLVEHPGERGETGVRGEPGSGPFRDGHSSPTCRLQLQTWHQVGRTWGQERARSRGAR